MLLVSISCMQNEIEPESQLQGDQVTNTPHIVQYDNEKSTMDSLSRVSKMQSDHDVLMMNSISYSHANINYELEKLKNKSADFQPAVVTIFTSLF